MMEQVLEFLSFIGRVVSVSFLVSFGWHWGKRMVGGK